MRYDRALRHTSSVRCLETFRSIFAVTLPLVSSNSWDAQLAIANDPRYARLETNQGIGQFSHARHHSKRRRRWVGVKGSTFNECGDPKCPSARRLRMVREDTGAPSEGATFAWMAADEVVGCTRAFIMICRSSRRLVYQ
ncbi:uncharacterized protein TNCV_1375461 [Trichonephila clavipes]|nr:uncharacterized protein TNCV_1375461 [Trichonephila clavipes]